MYPSIESVLTLAVLAVLAAGVAVLLSVPGFDALLGLLFWACGWADSEARPRDRRPAPALRGPVAGAGSRRG